MGSGLSSIGMERYIFVSKNHDHVFELKELRASALEFFTLAPEGRSDRERVADAYARLCPKQCLVVPTAGTLKPGPRQLEAATSFPFGQVLHVDVERIAELAAGYEDIGMWVTFEV